MRAFDQAKRWGIVPGFHPGTDRQSRDEARSKYRDELLAMAKEYRARARSMSRPPLPGPRPPVHEDPPPMPTEVMSPTTVEGKRLQDEMLAKYNQENDEWCDTVLFPVEAERVIWEAARDVREDWETERRAKRDLWRDEVYEWSPILLKVGLGLAGLATAAYFVWRIVG